MGFNEAVREGIRRYPRQAFGEFQHGDAACLLGTVGVPEQTQGRIVDYLSQHFADIPWMLVMACPHQDCLSRVPRYLFGVCAHLNDHHHWTREAIVEWVDPRPELHLAMPRGTASSVERTEREESYDAQRV